MQLNAEDGRKRESYGERSARVREQGSRERERKEVRMSREEMSVCGTEGSSHLTVRVRDHVRSLRQVQR